MKEYTQKLSVRDSILNKFIIMADIGPPLDLGDDVSIDLDTAPSEEESKELDENVVIIFFNLDFSRPAHICFYL